MKKVNLTHGGFYGHFRSRSNLLAEALKRALEDGAAAAGGIGVRSERAWSFPGFVRGYLSRAHRDARENGCAIAALISDVARADPECRGVMSDYVGRYIRIVTESLGEEDEANAIVAFSAMIGALALSRVIVDPKRSNAVLKCVREYVMAMHKGGR